MGRPGIIIAGTNSGCGKTTVTAGLLAALVKRGLKVQPYKVGPDFIDPMFHTFITGRYSRNLDGWMLDEGTVNRLYAKNASGADITVVEGVMGMYDGFGIQDDVGSTAHIARIIGLPVILVVDPEGMALSAAALVKGFMEFGGRNIIKGVIFNGIDSEGHYLYMKDIVEKNNGIKVLGYLGKADECRLESRHLGLVTAAEVDRLREKTAILCKKAEETIDIAGLLEIAGRAAAYGSGNDSAEIELCHGKTAGRVVTGGDEKVRIAVAMDRAFCFYYRDNLELLEEFGAELEYFSPLDDKSLLAGIDGLYIGGGYPEVWAGALESNTGMRQDIKSRLAEGLPAYAECGGLMYMCRSLKDENGRSYEMAGVIPGECRMTKRLNRFGYAEISITGDNVLACTGWKIRGHEFHFSDIETGPGAETCYRVTHGKQEGSPEGKVKDREVLPGETTHGKGGPGNGAGWNCGYRVGNLLAGYAHLHFWSNPLFAARFVQSCRLRKHDPEWRT